MRKKAKEEAKLVAKFKNIEVMSNGEVVVVLSRFLGHDNIITIRRNELNARFFSVLENGGEVWDNIPAGRYYAVHATYGRMWFVKTYFAPEEDTATCYRKDVMEFSAWYKENFGVYK